jgi:hypothetical protein
MEHAEIFSQAFFKILRTTVGLDKVALIGLPCGFCFSSLSQSFDLVHHICETGSSDELLEVARVWCSLCLSHRSGMLDCLASYNDGRVSVRVKSIIGTYLDI